MSNLSDDDYELKVLRLSDQSAFRQFSFTVASGKIQHHERSALDVQPHQDLIVPRVLKRKQPCTNTKRCFGYCRPKLRNAA